MKPGALTPFHNPMIRKRQALPVGPLMVTLSAVAVGVAALRWLPGLKWNVFMGGAARLAGLFSGVPATRAEEGWLLPFAGQPVNVTEACSATDFFLMTTALLGWHFARCAPRPTWLPVAAAGALLAAVLVTLAVNALRIVAVAQAHRWVISRLPAAYESFLHMFTGAVVFLTALIVLNLLFEIYGRSLAESFVRNTNITPASHAGHNGHAGD